MVFAEAEVGMTTDVHVNFRRWLLAVFGYVKLFTLFAWSVWERPLGKPTVTFTHWCVWAPTRTPRLLKLARASGTHQVATTCYSRPGVDSVRITKNNKKKKRSYRALKKPYFLFRCNSGQPVWKSREVRNTRSGWLVPDQGEVAWRANQPRTRGFIITRLTKF